MLASWSCREVPSDSSFDAIWLEGMYRWTTHQIHMKYVNVNIKVSKADMFHQGVFAYLGPMQG